MPVSAVSPVASVSATPSSSAPSRASAFSDGASQRITIRRENGGRNVYKGGRLIAQIIDHRGLGAKDKWGRRIDGDWGVAWVSGRYDWHNTYQEASDNALKG